MFHSASLL
uniref:Uncharacterized protein n=1 Tax=Arundo donax TaxID=35708 RepID=A0A0A9A7S2_ARUDO